MVIWQFSISSDKPGWLEHSFHVDTGAQVHKVRAKMSRNLREQTHFVDE